jgi:hypothetical protein
MRYGRYALEGAGTPSVLYAAYRTPLLGVGGVLAFLGSCEARLPVKMNWRCTSGGLYPHITQHMSKHITQHISQQLTVHLTQHMSQQI